MLNAFLLKELTLSLLSTFLLKGFILSLFPTFVLGCPAASMGDASLKNKRNQKLQLSLNTFNFQETFQTVF